MPRPYRKRENPPLAISELGLDFPIPSDQAFVARVKRELATALIEARDVMCDFTKGRCKACGGPWDQITRGCDNCHARHGMRRIAARRAGS